MKNVSPDSEMHCYPDYYQSPERFGSLRENYVTGFWPSGVLSEWQVIALVIYRSVIGSMSYVLGRYMVSVWYIQDFLVVWDAIIHIHTWCIQEGKVRGQAPNFSDA